MRKPIDAAEVRDVMISFIIGAGGAMALLALLYSHTTTQAPDRDDILNVGGFSDAVFSVVAAFLADDANRFVTEVESIEL